MSGFHQYRKTPNFLQENIQLTSIFRNFRTVRPTELIEHIEADFR